MSASSCFRVALLAPALAIAASGLTACSGNTGSADLPSEANPLDSEESDVIYGLNQLRTGLGLQPVTNCYSLNVSAAAHSDDLRDNPSIAVAMPGSDGSTVTTRACKAGYTPACNGAVAMGEVVAAGYPSGNDTLAGWETDMTAGPIIKSAGFIVVGVGRSQGPSEYVWTMDLGGVTDPSCKMP